MKWIKKGLIFGQQEFEKSLIYNPQVPYAIELDNCIRIFFGARKDSSTVAEVYCIDVDKADPSHILQINNNPVLARGEIGAFDEDGVLPVCLKKVRDQCFMYFGGFTKHVTHPHTCMMGLAASEQDVMNFQRRSAGPVLPISTSDPYLIGSADIIIEQDIWHMIYTSGTGWSQIEGALEVSYTLKHAYSKDGISWTPTNKVVIEQEDRFDAFAKPAIFKLGGTFFMYYSKRQIVNYRAKGESAYTLGLAYSSDLINWTRDDSNSGIEASTEGWDSEMICYPNIIEVNGRFLMFYNGNGFGKSGFGYAELVK